MRRPRSSSVAFIGVAILISSVTGYAVTQASASKDTQFRFAVTRITAAAIPGTAASWAGQGTPGENFFTFTCGWPNGRTSITVAEAPRYPCTPYAGGIGFPVLAPGSSELLSSPINDKWPEAQNGDLSDELRFVRRVGSVMTVGPVLLEYGDYSGGARPSFDKADGSLWIFDYRTENGPEVIRISTSTGALLQRTVMPAISRPIVGVNSLGFWLAQDFDSLYPNSGVTLGVWFAANGAARGELVKATPDGDAMAMQADSGAMDVFMNTQSSQNPDFEVWRFTPVS